MLNLTSFNLLYKILTSQTGVYKHLHSKGMIIIRLLYYIIMFHILLQNIIKFKFIFIT